MQASREELRLRAKRRADKEDSEFVSDQEWNHYLNEGLAELHEIVVGKHEDFFVQSATISLSSGVDKYDLPDDYLMMRGVDLVSGNRSYTLRPFMFRERNRLEWHANRVTVGNWYMYQVVGSRIHIIPDPVGSDTLTLWYVPQAPKLENDGQRLSVVYANGWERYIVLYAAIKAWQKEETDVSQLMPELVTLQQRIEANAGRSSADPKRVVDVRYRERHHGY